MDFNRSICQSPEASLPREWLETNGRGDYGTSSILGCNTRKYHGMLVASLPELHNKFVLLSKMETSVMEAGSELELSTNHYPGAFHPKGHEHLQHFSTSPSPTWSYRWREKLLQVSYALQAGEHRALFRYELLEGGECQLRLKPFLAYRINHTEAKANEFFNGTLHQEGESTSVFPYEGMPGLHFHPSAPVEVESMGNWFNNIEFYRERERGFDYHEDLFCPMAMEVKLQQNSPFYLSVDLEQSQPDTPALWETEMARREQARAPFAAEKRDFISILKEQGAHFLTRNARNELSITAGFPWFVEWGRDTMIALPGLTIYRGQPELGLEILKSYAGHEKHGLIPNYLAIGDGDHAYNSIDASLWFFWAIGELLKVEGYRQRVIEDLLPTMEKIISTYREGGVPQARLLDNGLITAGHTGTQLTWMDANAYGRPATPRNGCPVEINGLFLHGLSLVIDLKSSLGQDCGDLQDLANKTSASFVEAFWLEEPGYLADVVQHEPDGSLRPNQAFALSLPSCPLSREQKQRAVAAMRRDLLTPFGMRTLSPHSHMFRPRYEGNGDERDSAYHQGTVWPWLLGHFVEASLLCSDDPKAEASRLAQDLQPLVVDHLDTYGIGSIAEVYDATAPHRPGGCIAQAWSVSEVIRAFDLIDQHLES